MKKLSMILVMLLWCNVGFAASSADIIRICAQYKWKAEYGTILSGKEAEEFISPQNYIEGHPFLTFMAECEEIFQKYPITMREVFDY